MADNRTCIHAGCRARPLADSEACVFHDPRYAEQGNIARTAGGKNSQRGRKPPANITEVREALAEVATDMRRGKLSAKAGQIIVCALRSVLHGFEVEELKRANDLVGRKPHAEPC